MKRLARKAIIALPFGKRLIEWYARFQLNQMARSFSNDGDFFSHMYHTKLWGSNESASGPGSTLEYTENIRHALPILFGELGVSRIFDAPCGDYNWFRHVERGESVHYLGADIVPALIASNQERYGNEITSFSVIDIRNDALPHADLWLCRDALFHFSNNDVFLTLHNFLHSEIPYLLTSSHTDCQVNADIPTGSFRWLNLERAPFNLCKPEQYIEDWIEGFPVRSLCLWKRDDLCRSLEANASYASAVKIRSSS